MTNKTPGIFFGPCAHDMRHGIRRLIGEDNYDKILQEFETLENFAFRIIEASLYSNMKYGSINSSFGDDDSAKIASKASRLNNELQKIKQEFCGK